MNQKKFSKVAVSLENMERKKLQLFVYLDQIESFLIAQAMAKYHNNKTHAADALGINRTTFVMKIRKLHDLGLYPNQDKLRETLDALFDDEPQFKKEA